MGYIKGIVERVHVGDPQPPKQEGWSKSARFGLQVEGKWWNDYVNEDKKSGAFQVKDKDYSVITEGCMVEFMTTTNTGKDGKVYENMDKKTLKILGSTQPPEQQNTQQVAQQPTATQNAPVSASNDTRRAELEQRVCDGLAAMSALYKLEGKELPADDMLDRVSGFFAKSFKR